MNKMPSTPTFLPPAATVRQRGQSDSMRGPLPACGSAICSRKLGGQAAAACLSTEPQDCAWDDFLESINLGHFQQSSRWAQAKISEGWRPIRILLTVDGQMAGGFQILTRRNRAGQFGYVSKGPVLVPEEPALVDFTFDTLISVAKANHLLALIIQPPDLSRIDQMISPRHRLLPNHLVSVISATLLTELSYGIEEICRRIRRQTRVEIKQSRRRGIKLREGGEDDIGTFFRLMLATCERQHSTPVPPTESALRAIWKAFSPHRAARLTLAEYEGEAVAGAFCLCFGDRVTIWKKGWSGRHGDRHPNQPLMLEAIQWAQRAGFKLFDFAALRSDIAASLLQGQPLTEAQKQARDFFHLSYGTRAMLLPQDRIFINNAFARLAYKLTMCRPWFRAMAKPVLKL